MKASTNYLFRAFTVLSLCLLQPVYGQSPDAQLSDVNAKSANDSTQSEKPKRVMSAELTELADARQLEESGLKSGKLAAAVALACKSGAKIRADLLWISGNGSPAGRLYAAALINRFDKTAGRAAFKALASQMPDVNVDFVGLKERCHYSVSDLVIDQASAQPLINLVGKSI